MKHTSSTTVGLLVAVLAAVAFGTSGAFIKPVLASGWSPAAAVTVRALIGGLVLAPFALIALRGRWDAVWRGRWRLLGMGLIGVAATQLVYFAALQTIAVGTAILVEYMAPLLLVAVAWVLTRRRPATVVLVGSVVSLVGLVLVVTPSGGSTLDPVGLLFAILAMVGCAAYYVISARPAKGLPPVAFAAIGLLIGALSLWLAGLVGVPFTTSDADVTVLGTDVVWWVPLLFVGVVSTAVAYASSITASQMLGSRLASFAGLLEVVAATGFAWILLGEQLSLAQLLGGVCILLGIGFVRSERAPAVPIPVPVQ
ncbi:Threonine/homoserine efflux transporter RhtA [Plantibacter flavus]|uniref:Threonine/homoserine efflux transporter RhtA n=1 Tax=Plantibacter flavus TaxID=150123 RepID=A0A3N2BY57_9MICO|nr:DMT family transporter [Plantibacter flavus]ROR80153.1 threonine/homoserine efflux transporter RhtA [Plantibacter flavus]SMG50705.1 Threonine/homoserine efflux transporter RhtA [Plantibacter flavus]